MDFKLATTESLKSGHNREPIIILVQELQLKDQTSYEHFLRMDIESFEEILQAASPLIEKQDTFMRKAITPGERLALTFQFLATGIYNIYIIHPHTRCSRHHDYEI